MTFTRTADLASVVVLLMTAVGLATGMFFPDDIECNDEPCWLLGPLSLLWGMIGVLTYGCAVPAAIWLTWRTVHWFQG